jgi:hypothetical protein
LKEIIAQMQSKIETLEGGLRTIVAEEIARALGTGKEEGKGLILKPIHEQETETSYVTQERIKARRGRRDRQ